MKTGFPQFLRAAMVAGAALLAFSGGPAEARAHRHGRAAGDPVVVELYTAQGCATCPKANGVIGDLLDKKGVLPLTFSVDYWDYLGWEDTLAKPEFATRQRAYAQKLRVREIYTPEIVVGGAAEAPALERKTIDGLIAQEAKPRRRSVQIKILRHDTRVRVSGAGASADVWLVRYDPKDQTVKIRAGENKGQTVVIRNAVRELKRVGVWRGASKTYALPAAEDEGLKTLVIVQAPRGGPILATARG
jgi:hypothetical protein